MWSADISPGEAQFFSEGSRGRISVDQTTLLAAHMRMLQILSDMLYRIQIFCARRCAAEFFPEDEVLFFMAHARNGVILRGLRWMYE